MQRVIVPLDESPFSESILPYAARVAGRDGEVILIHAASGPTRGEDRTVSEDALATYLQDSGQKLGESNVRVRTKVYREHHVERAIEEAVREFGGTMVASSTEGLHGSRALTWGDPAWQAIAHSTVPVLLRHGEPDGVQSIHSRPHGPSRVMVPLDGSQLAEKALPVAADLAREWNAQLVLVRVVPAGEEDDARAYLSGIAGSLGVPAEVHVRTGDAEPELVQAAFDFSTTDIVMTSHGRTGLARVLLGSVTAGLLHDLVVPIVVIPALASRIVPRD